MKVGIPKGLLNYKYYIFLEKFFDGLGAEIITSPDTNKQILDEGVKYCVNEACLPIKVFHGHVVSIKDKCDLMVIPRIMQIYEHEFVCPKFCGLPEMILSSIPNMPKTTMAPIYATSKEKLYKWIDSTGGIITKNKLKIIKAYSEALREQNKFKLGIKTEECKINVALIGHPYNVYDNFINMNLVKKLNKLGVGVITEEFVDDSLINNKVKDLFKRPFWTFARKAYGAATYLAENKKIDGIVYISSFACGIDSVIIELIKEKMKDFPFLTLKVDEHTGESGFDTRIEAFVDMLERRQIYEDYGSSSW
ncbi:acyl-CoA dehydratase activase-related protein [Clostridium saccharoperbutylacetonicum]|uniref:acyl-CoA dehydratase activase-related protein n=1 Tax=Clostridium saccharoperbutylacetonicum TaxID=36745 RepID=UPI000983FBF6|nr:acyl-CoA dehydratase activase-related protein [Clostridium saccharoperbutylacetonicum]AQR93673.1 2-hydroxyglutaryl-CoA dehydratase, D-component [Clostridium saccharoperbutylacetonicum]NSB29372.1 putative nucleotide-binding protein (sugar kinase/HSP70/actin superfamily) [Clostridium saccharoperbutylacetonicum]